MAIESRPMTSPQSAAPRSADQARQRISAVRCLSCASVYRPEVLYRCPSCGGLLEVDRPEPQTHGWTSTDFVNPEITLGEGNTPLREVSPILLHPRFQGRLLLKDETRNPSGSFKDRFVAAAVSHALECGARGIICASSGNAGASAACYAANAGVPSIIVCPEKTPYGKLTQITAYGAQLERLPGHYSNSFQRAKQIAVENGYVNVTSTYLNPYGVDALRLVGHEIAATLVETPDWIIIPTGAGPLVKGVYQGFRDRGGTMPRLVAAQAAGCAPIVRAVERRETEVTAWDTPATFASGISDPLQGYADEGTYTLSLLRETGGTAVAAGDDAIRAAMTLLATRAGVFAEPTGACSLAAARLLFLNGTIDARHTVVCMVTGHGFKDFSAWGM